MKSVATGPVRPIEKLMKMMKNGQKLTKNDPELTKVGPGARFCHSGSKSSIDP